MAAVMENSLWKRDDVQFARLLAEIAATVELTDSQINNVCQSMDITRDELTQLFRRAEINWEELKQRHTGA